MPPFVATYPPLGQVTTLAESSVAIHAVLEVPRELAGPEPWHLVLWHSEGESGDWKEAEFVADGPEACPTDLHETDGSLVRQYFTARVSAESSLRFTVKFRQNTVDQDWSWVRIEQGSDDGVVVIAQKPTREGDPEDLPDLIRDLNPHLQWKSHMSQCPGTRLWSMEAAVDGAKGNESTFVEVPLGVPWGRFLRWFALVRTWTPWLAPRHGKTEFQLDKDALLCSFLSPQGKHLVILGTTGQNDVTTLFRSASSGHVNLYIRSDNAENTTGTALVSVGDDLETTIAAVMYHARSLVTAADTASAPAVPQPTTGTEIGPQWFEEWYDGLGYCTWNSLGQELNEEKVLKALDTLAENNIHISSLIIDDNWQDIDYRGDGQWQHGWNDFEAEPKTFPRGLAALVSDIRAKHKNIQHIAVWHALLGYWAGLAPDGPLAKRYKTVSVTRDDTDKAQLPIDSKMTLVTSDDVSRFYDDFYRFLAASGIDGVKTDGQYMLDTLTTPSTRRSLIPAYLDAWTLASLRHFPGRAAISCMSLAPPILFRNLLRGGTRPPIVLRNSDDYFPGVPSAQPWHVFANAHNALFTRHLGGAVLDWDMFQTVDPDGYAAFHATARCVSGGPVYVTDVPGEHDLDLLKQVCAPSPRAGGKTVVFRPGVPGRSLDAYVGYRDPGAGSLVKVGAYHGRAATGASIVGVLNVAERALTEVVPLARFPGVVGSERYVVRAHGSGRVTPPLVVGAAASLLTVSLGAKGADVLCAYPLQAVGSRTRGEVLLANLGLVGKMTGCAAVLRTEYEVRENGRVMVDAVLKALGVLGKLFSLSQFCKAMAFIDALKQTGIYISTLPELSVQDDFMVTIQGQPLPPHTVAVNLNDSHVLDVDIETAWKEMELESGWANEVEVKVFFALEKK